jgi:hypothetical protein
MDKPDQRTGMAPVFSGDEHEAPSISEVAVRRLADFLSWNEQSKNWQLLKNSFHV